jgi:hypothetical protein
MSTIAELQADLEKYKAARDRILTGAQDVSDSGGRRMTHADLKVLEQSIADLERRISIASNSGRAPGSSVVFGGNRG